MSETDGEIRAYRFVSSLTQTEPTFVPAAHRILAAGSRCSAINELLDECASGWRAHVQPRARVGDPYGTVKLDFPGTSAELADLGAKVATLASEVLHHARTALDYIAYHAAWLDGGFRNGDTQFPLAVERSEWMRDSKGKWLRGVSEEHLGWIEEVQPFRTVKWSSNLKMLSNQDKHRVAVDIRSAYTVEFPLDDQTVDPLGDPTYLGFNVRKREISLLIKNGLAPADGQEDIEALPLLWDIVTGVAGVANRFLTAEGHPAIQIATNAGA
jgi:hypothetical protein